MTSTTTSTTALAAGPNPAPSVGVHLAGVSKRFGALDALAGIDLDIAEGEFVAIIGASGCGKSTLLRIVAGFETASGGTVTVRGTPVRGPGPDRGVVFQDYGLFPWLSVADNIGWGPRQRKASKAQIAAIVDRFLRLVQLEAFAGRYPGQLSGGMQQRVAIARVLANDPAVLLMDEPFGALDSLTREKLQRILLDIWHEVGSTVLFITHSVEEAVFLADRVVVMTGGPNHGCPGRVADVIRVDLAHPRDVTSPAFNDIKRGLLEMVHRDVAILG